MKWHDFEIAVNRSARRKTMHIVIERDGNISVQVPSDMEDMRISDILDSKEYEIHQKLICWRETNQEKIERIFVSGQSFLYLGKNYNLHIIEGQKRMLLLKDGKFLLSSLADYPRDCFVKFYKKQAKAKIEERIAYYLPQINKQPQKVGIRDLPTRWASCTPEGNIYFNWKCVMAPLIVLDYLIIHELVHLEYPNHSREFWNRVSTIMPNYEERREWLRRNGVRMTI